MFDCHTMRQSAAMLITVSTPDLLWIPAAVSGGYRLQLF